MNFGLLRSFADRIPSISGTPGGGLAVWREHQELFRYTFGVRDPETGEPMTGDELYFFYSATKPITCVAILQLFERGLLGLNDPVSEYLPEYALVKVKRENGELTPPKRPITIRHLLTMTSGMDYNLLSRAVLDAVKRADGNPTTREVVRALSETPLSFDPGDRWQYSLSHDVLAAVVEVVSGMTFSSYIKKYLFDPLGMTESGFHAEEFDLSRFPVPYRDTPAGKCVRTKKENTLSLGRNYESGGASLISSVGDYIRFTDAMANGGVGLTGARILHPGTIDLMRENATGDFLETYCTFGAQMDGYGYGLGVRTLISKSRGASLSPLGEFGWDGAWGTYLVIDPVNKLSLVYAEQRGTDKAIIHPRLRNLTYLSLDA